MKFSTVVLSAAFLGLVGYMGSTALDPRHPERSFKGIFHKAGMSTGHGHRHDPFSGIDTKALQQLKEKEAAIIRQIREAESSLRQLESSEKLLKRRLHELERESRIIGDTPAGLQAIRTSELSLHRYMKALEDERDALQGVLEQLKSEQATCKVKINLWGVKVKREMMEKIITRDGRGPLDDLKDEVDRRASDRRNRSSIGIVY